MEEEKYKMPSNSIGSDRNIGISAVSWLVLFQLVLWNIDTSHHCLMERIMEIGISAVSWLILSQLVLWKIAAWRKIDTSHHCLMERIMEIRN
jgi:hypothetical protein